MQNGHECTIFLEEISEVVVGAEGLKVVEQPLQRCDANAGIEFVDAGEKFVREPMNRVDLANAQAFIAALFIAARSDDK